MARFLCFFQASKTCSLLTLLLQLAFFSSAFLINIPIALSLLFVFLSTLFPKRKPSLLLVPEKNNEPLPQEPEKDNPTQRLDHESSSTTSSEEEEEEEEDRCQWLHNSGNMAREENSDDEGLFEIAIPSGQFVISPEKDEHPIYLRCCSKVLNNKDFLAEEDNFIEIDIYMGSIKCSRYAIQPTTTTSN